MQLQPEFRSPNSRNPEEARNPKSELSFSRSCETVLVGHLPKGGVSDFGLRICFGARISDFGFRVQPLLALALALALAACNDDPKPKAEPKKESKLGENPVAAPLDYIAAIGKAQKATLGRLEQARLIDAIQKFEASESRPPKELSELVPNFLPALPPAPAGMKLEYKAADGSFMFVPLAPAPAGK